jgi:hypothetical protein
MFIIFLSSDSGTIQMKMNVVGILLYKLPRLIQNFLQNTGHPRTIYFPPSFLALAK